VKALGLLIINSLFRANKVRDTNESPFPSFPWNLLLVRSAFLEIIATEYALIMKVHDVALLPWL
jgi:hypothetical protein